MAGRIRMLVAVLLAVGFGACTGSGTVNRTAGEGFTPITTSTTLPYPTYTVAAVTGKAIDVFAAPDAPKPERSLPSPDSLGYERVFLVTKVQSPWLEVLVPVRPNGSKGWIREADVKTNKIAWRILVEIGAHRVTAWNGLEVFHTETVAVGTGGTPTPTGAFYVTQVIPLSKPNGPYGPFALGLSGFSDVLTSFAGGPGQVALHGTNNAAALGRDVSHGCVRLSNPGIAKLASAVPPGTPVMIVP